MVITFGSAGYTDQSNGTFTPYSPTGNIVGDGTSAGILNTGNAQTGAGNDVLNFKDWNSGLLANYFVINGGSATLDLGGGNDQFLVQSMVLDSFRSLYSAGSGDDIFKINYFALTRDDAGVGKLEFNMGDGNDKLTLSSWGSNQGVQTQVTADGGAGTDVFELTGSLSNYTFSKSGDDLLVTQNGVSGVTVTVKNFEDFVVGGVTYDTVDALLNAAATSGGGSGSGGGSRGGSRGGGNPSGIVVPGGPTTVTDGTLSVGIINTNSGRLMPFAPGTVEQAFENALGVGNSPLSFNPPLPI